MKKLVVILLFIPLISFSQDFRKMSFGQSTEELKETYPQYEFTVENEMGMITLSHDDLVGGVETTVYILHIYYNICAVVIKGLLVSHLVLT
mgnify:CR=1 FL=1